MQCPVFRRAGTHIFTPRSVALTSRAIINLPCPSYGSLSLDVQPIEGASVKHPAPIGAIPHGYPKSDAELIFLPSELERPFATRGVKSYVVSPRFIKATNITHLLRHAAWHERADCGDGDDLLNVSIDARLIVSINNLWFSRRSFQQTITFPRPFRAVQEAKTRPRAGPSLDRASSTSTLPSTMHF